MPVIDIEIVREGNLDEVRRRLGNTGNMRAAMSDMLDQAARIGEVSAEIYAPERTRRLRREISSSPAKLRPTGSIEATVGVGRVFSLVGGRAGPPTEGAAEYPYYVHEGTGLFGRFHREIRPVRAKAMRFMGSTGLVYAKKVRGQRPQPFIREAYDDVLAFMPAAIDKMVARILGDR